MNFIIIKRPLGCLEYLRICNEMNGGSWFLKFIIVHDLQTRDKSYFICNNWLSIDKEDCLNERILPIALDKQKTEFKYLFEKETKYKLNDSHLWLSILTKPLNSTFYRTERLTCCFVLMLMVMLMNIMYYDALKSDQTQDGLKIGSITITITQISISIITNLIIAPPSLLLIYLFRKSSMRITKSDKLKNAMKKIKGNSKIVHPINNKNKKNKNKVLPWWCRIIAYLLCLLISVISIFFIIVKGISLGNDKTTQWLTSIILSLFSSLIIIQPLQVSF